MPLCSNPYMNGSMPCPCGQCEECLKGRKNLWKHRILLEADTHEHSSFITLTYRDEDLVFINEKTGEFTLPTLTIYEYQNFFKKLRKIHKNTGKPPLRYYIVGEYGDQTWRPHYHIALFGYEPCWHGQTRRDRHAKGKSCCPPCDLLLKTWGKGAIDSAPIEPGTAGYIAGYVTKKLTKADNPKLEGRLPEFGRMSTKPGIGARCIETLADALFTEHGKDALTEHGDVPIYLENGATKIPLGRYLRSKLRLAIGVNDATTQKSLEAYQKELLDMWADHLDDPSISKYDKLSLKAFLQSKDHQKVLNSRSKTKLFKKRKDL